MIKELNTNKSTNWEEQIELKLSLADLQIIYDCVGAVPLRYLRNKHQNTNFDAGRYTANIVTNIYHELEDIIFAHNGVTDHDEHANLSGDLVMSIDEDGNE